MRSVSAARMSTIYSAFSRGASGRLLSELHHLQLGAGDSPTRKIQWALAECGACHGTQVHPPRRRSPSHVL
jgi:hypothetical protein